VHNSSNKENFPENIPQIKLIKKNEKTPLLQNAEFKKFKFNLKSANSFSLRPISELCSIPAKKRRTQLHLIESKTGKSGIMEIKDSLRITFKISQLDRVQQ